MRSKNAQQRNTYRPAIEQLESRRVLATLTVNAGNLDPSAPDAADRALVAGEGIDDGLLTLREAIAVVNGSYDPQSLNGDQGQISDGLPGTPDVVDLIKFDPRVFGFPTAGNPNRTPVIELLHGGLLISNSVTVDGAAPTEIDGDLVAGPGWENLTIDASGMASNTDSVIGNGSAGGCGRRR